MAQSIYFLDIYIPNEGEIDSALEIGVLQHKEGDERPSVYLHSFIKPASPSRVRWVNAMEQGISRDTIINNKYPSLNELIGVDFFKNKTVVCLNPNAEPYISFLKNASSSKGLLNMWQHLFKDNEEALKVTRPSQMLEFLHLPSKDSSGAKYTPLLCRLHSLVAIWELLHQYESKKIDLFDSLNMSTLWPIKSPDFSLLGSCKDFASFSESAINTIFSDNLCDYLDWYQMQIYSHDWVFNRPYVYATKHLKNKVAMSEYIYTKALSDSMKLWVLIYYSIYERKTAFAREIALKKDNLKFLPDSIREDFASFLIGHLDEFLTKNQKYKLIETMIYHAMADRATKNFESYDFDSMYHDSKKNKSTLFFFRTIAIPSNSSIKCFKQISNNHNILYRRYEIIGEEQERYEALVKVNELFSEFKREIKKPLSSFWLDHEIQFWIQYVTGFSFEELAKDPSINDDPKLTDARELILKLTMECGDRWAKDLHARLSKILTELKECKEQYKDWKFVFQGISVEIIFKTTKVPLIKRLLRF